MPLPRLDARTTIGLERGRDVVALHGGRLRAEMGDVLRNVLVHLYTGAAYSNGAAKPDIAQAKRRAHEPAALRMRAAQERLRRLRGDPSEGGERKRLVDEVAQAGADFQTQAGVPLSELTEQVGGGLTTEGATDEVVIAPLEPAP